jgi:pyrroline-5-carboxylate reductase
MKLGFIGTGTIASAMITGLKSGNWGETIVVSPRNSATAARLARLFTNVEIAATNQEVLERCDDIVISVRPQVAAEVLNTLTFDKRHHVISVVATLSLATIQGLVPAAGRVTRAIPLPPISALHGATAVFPPDRSTIKLFDKLGSSIAVDTESSFDALLAASSAMATYFRILGTVEGWLVAHSIPPGQARRYVSQLFYGLAIAGQETPVQSLIELRHEYTTAGGLNQQLHDTLDGDGFFDLLHEGLDKVFSRVTGRGRETN